MEKNTIKKHFSKLGLVLFLGTLLIYGIQWLSLTLAENIPAIADNNTLSFLCAMLPMYVIAYPIIFLMLKTVPAYTGLEKKKMKPLHIIAAFAMTFSAAYICNLIANMITMVIGIIKQSPVQNVILDLTGSIHPLANLFIIAICAPVMEELLFRKFIVDRTVQYGEGVAIVFSGLVFGFFHGNLVQFMYATTLGMFFAFIYIKTGNIIYTTILHFLQNFISSFVAVLILEKSGYMELMEVISGEVTESELMQVIMDNAAGLCLFAAYIIIVLCVVLAGIILFLVNMKKFTVGTREVIIPKGSRFKTLFLNVGVILYCVFWIVMMIMQLLR